MGLRRIILARVAMGLTIAWGVLSLVFALFTMTDDWVLNAELGLVKFAGGGEELLQTVREEYLMARGLDQPLWQSYIEWLGNMVLLEWDTSFNSGEPAFDIVMDSAIRTGMYVVPALVIAITIGVLLGLYAATNQDSHLASGGVFIVYLLFVVPMFWLGGMVLTFDMPEWVYEHGLPIALTTAALLGSYVSYARAHSLEYASREFTKLVKAKGASNVQVAKHVLRNAAIPFFSMLFTEVMALILLAIFVIETVFGIQGFGYVLLDAITQRDLPVVLGATLVVISIGVMGNIIQDAFYSYFDPRVDTGRREV